MENIAVGHYAQDVRFPADLIKERLSVKKQLAELHVANVLSINALVKINLMVSFDLLTE